MSKKMHQITSVFLSGIGGIGMSALAKFFLAQGKTVAGSDIRKSEITEELERLGVDIVYEQIADNVTENFDLLVYSAAVPETNPEREQALALGVSQKSYVDVLGDLSKTHRTVAVSGTNGKSTTTAMLAAILIDANEDPTVIVGSKFKKIQGNFREGKSDLLVLEACEYRDHMLKLTPSAIVLTNLEEEHLDYFRDMAHILESFQKYVAKLSNNADNILVVNNDDTNIDQLELPNCKVVTYGINEVADLMAKDIKVEPGRQTFEVEYRGTALGRFELQVPGRFNVFNALAAMAYSLQLGVPVATIKRSLSEFTGLWRRFEKVQDSEVAVISDYAHHPSAIKGTIRAAKEFYPERRIVAVFQPHQYDRTKKLFADFVDSLYEAEIIILPEIFDVAGRDDGEDAAVSSRDLVQELKERWPDKKVLYAKDVEQALDLVNFNLRQSDIVLVMGAGNVYEMCAGIKLQ